VREAQLTSAHFGRPLEQTREPVEMSALVDSRFQHSIESELSCSVGKALTLVSAFTTDRPTIGVSELGRRCGLSKSTTHRLVTILVSWGVLERSGKRYSIGPWIRELAYRVEDSNRRLLRETALPYLQDLYEGTHETIHLAVLDGSDVVYLEKLYGHNGVTLPSRVGARLSAGCCGLGKAMMAFSEDEVVHNALRQLRPRTGRTIVAPDAWVDELHKIKDHGVAFDNEEAKLGVTCVAVPVLSHSGSVVAAVSVAGPVGRLEPARKASLVRDAALGIAKELEVQATRPEGVAPE